MSTNNVNIVWDNEVQGDGGNEQTCDKMLNVELTKIEIWWHDWHATFEIFWIWEFRAGMWDLGNFSRVKSILISLMYLMFILFLKILDKQK